TPPGLSLQGALRPTPGSLGGARAAARAGKEGVIVPEPTAAEAALVEGIRVVGAPSLRTAVESLRGTWRPAPPPRDAPAPPTAATEVDLSEVRGQQQARRALEVAAAGGHHLPPVGSPRPRKPT